MRNLAARLAMMAKKTGGGGDVTLVDYIEVGTQGAYIDVDFDAYNGIGFYVNYYLPSYGCTVFGTAEATDITYAWANINWCDSPFSVNSFWFGASNNSDRKLKLMIQDTFYWCPSSYTIPSCPDWHIFNCDNTDNSLSSLSATLDGSTFSVPKCTKLTTASSISTGMSIFSVKTAVESNRNVFAPVGTKLRELKFFDGSNVLADYLPAIRGSEVGVYDNVGGVFYAGVGNLTYA